jgi:hypothetical protein
MIFEEINVSQFIGAYLHLLTGFLKIKDISSPEFHTFVIKEL